MIIVYTQETEHFARNLTPQDRARLYRVKEYFERNGFSIGSKYIKKVTDDLWELRAGRIRLLLFIKKDMFICVYAFYKKTQKLPKQYIKLAEKRIKQL